MKSCKEKAAEWGISSRAVNDMCKKGKVAGAVKENGTWRIPDDAAKPKPAVPDRSAGIRSESAVWTKSCTVPPSAWVLLSAVKKIRVLQFGIDDRGSLWDPVWTNQPQLHAFSRWLHIRD